MLFYANHHIFCQADPQFLAKNKHLQGWFGPNHIYAWLQTAAEALQSRNWCMRGVCKYWDGNHTWIFHPNTPYTQADPQKFRTRTMLGTIWPKSHVRMIADCCRSIRNLTLLTSKDCKAWDGNSAWCFKPITKFPSKSTPSSGQNQATPGLIWPKYQ